MRALGSVVLEIGEKTAVPAGDALAVDREEFSKLIHEKLQSHSLIEYVAEEVSDPIAAKEKYNCEYIILATGPLTSIGLSNWIKDSVCGEDLYFYDAIAPVVDADSLDMSKNVLEGPLQITRGRRAKLFKYRFKRNSIYGVC